MKQKRVFGRADHRHFEGGRCGCCCVGPVSQARDVERDLLHVEIEIRRAGAVRGQAATRPRGGEWQAEAAFSRGDARQRRAEGPAWKKMVTPAARRGAVVHLRASLGVSERRGVRDRSVRTGRAFGIGRGVATTPRLRVRLRELAQQRRRFGYRRPAHPAVARGREDQSQEDTTALHRRGANRAQAKVRDGARSAPARRCQ